MNLTIFQGRGWLAARKISFVLGTFINVPVTE